jgi:hypothetical protein
MPAGTTHPIEVFELMGAAGSDAAAAALKARIIRWEAALAGLRAGHLAEAKAMFQALSAEDREDGLAAFYVERCVALEREGDEAGLEEVDRFGAR